jgi:hypothetical protein
MWGIIAVVFISMLLIYVLTSTNTIFSIPEWAKNPCSKCGSGKVKWLKGQDSNGTGEAAFFCKSCGYKEFRGGCSGEVVMENWESKK